MSTQNPKLTPLLVVFGPPSERWPVPLPAMLGEGRLALTALPTIYAAAAAVVASSAPVAGIVVNLGSLTRGMVEALGRLHAATGLPVILPPAAHELWLDTRIGDVEVLQPLLQPYAPEHTQLHPVTPEVNKVSFNRPEAMAPV